MPVPLTEKFIGFVDILGFKSLMRSVGSDGGMTHDELFAATKLLGTEEDRARRVKNGSQICPSSPCIQKDLEFHLTQMSDSVVVSAEISPAGVINVIFHCWQACLNLLARGLMCRGYITRGLIHHTDADLYGPGQVEAAERERAVSIFKREAEERGTPFIEIGKEVVEFVAQHTDDCVKDTFDRLTISDAGVTALFPMKRLSHKFLIGGVGTPAFNTQREKASNDKMRNRIVKLKDSVQRHVDRHNDSAVRKSEHYLHALDDQLRVCDKTDDVIDRLSQRPA